MFFSDKVQTGGAQNGRSTPAADARGAGFPGGFHSCLSLSLKRDDGNSLGGYAAEASQKKGWSEDQP
jgi:hypothetical protein